MKKMKTNNNQEDFRKPIPLGCAYSNPNNVFLNGHACVYDVRGIAPTLVAAMGGGNKPFIIERNIKK